MFKRRKEHKRRSSFLPFVLFRTILSMAIFAALMVGVYTAFKQFSGFDLIKLDLKKDPIVIVNSLLTAAQIKFVIPNSIGSLKLNNEDVSGVETELGVPTDTANDASTPKRVPKAPLSFKFILVADSHNDNDNLKKALKQTGGAFVIGIGDYTDVGTVDELKAAKKAFDSSGTRYFVTAGDHDLWDSRNQNKDPVTNFGAVFGPTYQSFSYKNARFLILDNSDNYLGLGDKQMDWLKQESDRIRLENTSNLVLAFVHEPLYHPSSSRMMGKVSEDLKNQAKDLINILKDTGVKEVFSGDIHYFTRYSDPDSGVGMTTIGAVTSTRNAQNPRFAVVSVYEDGSFDVEDTEIH